jgi:ABC-type multidrug transport system ATPase subunit
VDAPAIEVEGIVKRFGATVALNGVDLTAGEGKVIGLLGPNGSGKTRTFAVFSVISVRLYHRNAD